MLPAGKRSQRYRTEVYRTHGTYSKESRVLRGKTVKVKIKVKVKVKVQNYGNYKIQVPCLVCFG